MAYTAFSRRISLFVFKIYDHILGLIKTTEIFFILILRLKTKLKENKSVHKKCVQKTHEFRYVY